MRDARKSPELAKSHKPGHTWEWPKNSAALKEANTALAGLVALNVEGIVPVLTLGYRADPNPPPLPGVNAASPQNHL